MKQSLKTSHPHHQVESLLIVISGPSGVGKDSVVTHMAKRNLPFYFVVTATTRPPRDEEVHGVDYFFVSKDDFQEMIEKDELLEHAIVYGDFKGIPKSQVRQALASRKDVIMRLDVQGAATIRALCPDAVLIFLTATPEELDRRLKIRKSENPEELKRRIATAHKELERANEFDYIVENHDSKLDDTVDSIMAIIHAEHCRVNHRKVTL